MAPVDDGIQKADAKAKETRDDEYRAREWANLSDEERAARKSEAEALIKERDGYMKRGLTLRLEEVDERLRALGYREEQSTNANVQLEYARQLPDAERRAAVAAGKVPVEALADDDEKTAKGKGSK